MTRRRLGNGSENQRQNGDSVRKRAPRNPPRPFVVEPLEQRILLAGDVLYRINAGGPELAGSPAWVADVNSSPFSNQGTAGSFTFNTSLAIDVSDPSIPAGTPSAVFQTERWDSSALSEMQWSFPVAPGTYDVRLYFAEIYEGTQAVGARVFDVAMEGATVLNDYDVYADVGGYAGVVKTFRVTSDASLDILFTHVVENPAIKGIEILDANSQANVLGASSGSLNFGTVVVNASASQTITLTNLGGTGDPAIVVSSTNITGTNANQFSDSFNDASPITLPPGSSTSMDVSFSPTSAGAKSASLVITHSGQASPLIVPLSGVATSSNVAPVLSAIADISMSVEDSVVVALSATDANGDVIELAATGLPSFATLSDNGNGTGTILLAPGLADAGVYTITVTATDSGVPALSDSEPFVVTVSPNVVGGTVVYRVNAGGPSVAGDPSWTVDSSSQPSSLSNAPAAVSFTYSTSNPISLSHPSIPAGTPASLFQTERWDSSSGAEMAWAFAVNPGTYEVRLYFADIYSGTQAVGARVFDVSIEGSLVLDNYDIYAEVGGYTGVVKSFVVTSDASLDIAFGHVVENPAIKAIEILTTAGTNQLQASASNVRFNATLLGETTAKQIQIVNAGSAGDPAIVMDPSLALVSGADAGDFDVSFASATPLTLAPGQSTTLTLTFSPTVLGGKSATLAIPHSGSNSPLLLPLSGVAIDSHTISFGKSTLSGTSSSSPTTLQFGPDGRLYVGQQNGQIKIYTIEKIGENNYAVAATETITVIQSIPNHNDDGSLNANVTDRLVTGLLVVGTAANPVIYVASSDPRIGGEGLGGDLNLDTNSGILSRLTWNGTSWAKLDLVRGLPRSEENHGPNGMQLDPATNTLYLAQGGNTNMGAPSNNFAMLPEFALSAAILSIDLDAIGNTTNDLPTLNDENRPGVNDANDPFGGNDGKNQAILVPGGPVQVYAPGFRNPYDIVLTQDGRLYTVDNGPNAGWGDVPVGEGPAGLATNAQSEPGVTYGDALHLITGPGYYGGHPNPTRSNPANTFNTTNPQSPVSTANPIESDYLIPGVENAALTVFPFSTNGIVEYTASNFGGAMTGDLLLASFSNEIFRVKVDSTGENAVLVETLFNNVGIVPLDVTAQGNEGDFAGTIWVADWLTGSIIVFEPNDTGFIGLDDPDYDSDGDGYTNGDEAANGTSPTSAADFPLDFDGDFLSNLLDPDDDNDSLLDNHDPFAIDAANGMNTPLNVSYTWENDAPFAGGLFNLGFTGLMTNGNDDYASLFDASKLTAGGAAGVLTIDAIGAGDATGAANSQKYAFQFGVNAAGAAMPFTVHTRLVAPFAGQSPQGDQSMGLFLGNGDQDNYFKIVVTANGPGGQVGGVTTQTEIGGVVTAGPVVGLDLPGPNAVDLYLTVDPTASTVQASYTVTTGGVTTARALIGPAVAIPETWHDGSTGVGLAVGIIGTSAGAPEFTATWDLIEVSLESANVLSASTGQLNFGIAEVGAAATQTVVLTNIGAAGDPSITIDATSITGAAAFSDSFNDAGSIVLLPGQSTSIDVTFAPVSVGAHLATLQVVHSGLAVPLEIPLLGFANPPGSTAEAYFRIAPPSGLLDSSTYEGATFTVQNNSTGGQKITSLRIDLDTAILPDLVYDPDGIAGDIVGKGFTIDINPGVGVTGHAFSGSHDDGFDSLTVTFNGFDPGEFLAFSVDVDPTTIRGTIDPGPSESGSISGLELAGATITVVFDDGTTLTAQTFATAGSVSASEAIVRSNPPASPSIQVLGIGSSPTTVTNPSQVVRVSGQAGSSVTVIVVEAGLYVSGLPGGGFDVDPFEANRALGVTRHTATIGAGGFVDIAVALTRSSAEAGLNHIAAVVTDAGGRSGPLSNVLIVQLTDSPPTNQAPVLATIGTRSVQEGGSLAFQVSATDPNGNAITLMASGLPTFGSFANLGNGTGQFTFHPPAGSVGTYSITVTATDNGTPVLSDSETFSLVVTSAGGSGETLYRVNAGGPAIAGSPTWQADSESSPSPYTNASGAVSRVYSTTTTINMNDPSIPVGTPAAIFQTERWDLNFAQEMQWAFPVAAGTYEVRLYFAEIYDGAQFVGARVFDVTIEGALVLDNYDVYADVGGYTGVVQSFIVASDSVLDIVFGHVAENPAVKAIEILEVSSDVLDAAFEDFV